MWAFAVPLTAWLTWPVFGLAVLSAEILIAMAVVFTALYGSDRYSARAFRLNNARTELSFPQFTEAAGRLSRACAAAGGPHALRGHPVGAQRGQTSSVVTSPGAARRCPGRAGRPIVFVSYAHDSPAHKESVLDLCEFLARWGIDVRVDRWGLDERRDWQLWATAQILDSDFVVVIASPVCRQAGDGTIAPGLHTGLQSEMRLLREFYCSDPVTWTKKILPVVLPGRSVDEIPLFLQPRTADHFILTDICRGEARDLLRLLAARPPSSADTRIGPGLAAR